MCSFRQRDLERMREAVDRQQAHGKCKTMFMEGPRCVSLVQGTHRCPFGLDWC